MINMQCARTAVAMTYLAQDKAFLITIHYRRTISIELINYIWDILEWIFLHFSTRCTTSSTWWSLFDFRHSQLFVVKKVLLQSGICKTLYTNEQVSYCIILSDKSTSWVGKGIPMQYKHQEQEINKYPLETLDIFCLLQITTTCQDERTMIDEDG